MCAWSTTIAVIFLVGFGNHGDADGRLSNIFILYIQEFENIPGNVGAYWTSWLDKKVTEHSSALNNWMSKCAHYSIGLKSKLN